MKKEIIKEFEKWSETQKSYTKHDVFLAGYELTQQQISELKEQRDEMLAMIEDLISINVNYFHETEIKEKIEEAKQLIKKVKNE
jgi:hypothetical protein